MKLAPVALIAATLALTGCSRFFAAQGSVASDSGALGTWSSTPQGCTRDPFDGLPAPESSSILTFVWQDPGVHDPLRGPHRFTAPNAPMRLELSREPVGLVLQLDTVKTRHTRLDRSVCSTLSVETHESPRSIPEGRATLAGTISFDCRVAHSRLTANVTFQRCEF